MFYANGVCGCCDGLGTLPVGRRGRAVCSDCKGTGKRSANAVRRSLYDYELTNEQLYERWKKFERLYTAALNNNHRWAERVLERWEQVEDKLLARGVIAFEELGL